MRFVSSSEFELYLLLGASALLLIVELLNQHWTTALFAGVLGGLTLAIIRLRRDIGFIRSSKTGIDSVFLHETPADVINSFRQAEELLLSGVSLDRTLRNAYRPLESFLARGGSLKVLLVNPESDWAVRIADKRAYQEHGPELRKEHIESSIEAFKRLGRETEGNVEIRLTDDPLTFGGTMIDGDRNTRDTRIVIQHYSYKKAEALEPNPVFVVRPADGDWFAEFREELENLWRDGAALDGDEA